DSVEGEVGLDAVDGVVAVVEHRRCEHGVRARAKRLHDVGALADTARSDHRHSHGSRHRPQQLHIGTQSRAVAVPAREQDLPRAQPRCFARPRHRVRPRGLAAAERERFPLISWRATGIDGEYDALAAELGRELGEEGGALQCRRVHAHLVRARCEQPAGVVHAADATADGEGNADTRAHARHRLDLRVAPFGRRGHVEDDDLVRALCVVQAGIHPGGASASAYEFANAATPVATSPRPSPSAVTVFHPRCGTRTSSGRRRQVPAMTPKPATPGASALPSHSICIPRQTPSRGVPQVTAAVIAPSSLRARSAPTPAPNAPTPGNTTRGASRTTSGSPDTATVAPRRRNPLAIDARFATPESTITTSAIAPT